MRREAPGNVSHPTDSLPDMSYFETFQTVTEPAADPFDDPVRYLAEYGIEAELVAEVARLPEAA
jgi:hypothetical protein